MSPGQSKYSDKTGSEQPLTSGAIWLACVLAAAVCVWRVFSFTPVPIDSPGTLRPLFYRWFHAYVSLFPAIKDAWSVWDLACYVVVFSFPLLAVLNYLRERKTIPFNWKLDRLLCSQVFFWLAYAGCLVVCRYPILLRDELNPDEGQFLASAFKLFYDANFFHAADCHTSGPGNVYPLMWPAIFGISPDFVSGRLLGIAIIFLSIYCLYRTVRLVSNDAVARIAVLPAAVFFLVFTNTELLYLSSEHIPILLVSLAALLCVRTLVRPGEAPRLLFLLGLLASAAFFTKLQSFPIAAAAGVAALAFIWTNRDLRASLRATLLLIAGGLLPVLVSVLACLRAGVLNDYWQSYIIANIDYVSYGGSSVSWFLDFVEHSPEFEWLFFAVGVIAVIWLAEWAAALRKPVAGSSIPSGRNPVRWFGVLSALCTGAAFYAVIKPHRPFFHYLLLLIIPLALAVGWMLVSRMRNSVLLPVATALTTLACAIHLWSFQDSRVFKVRDMIRAPDGDLIRTVTEPGSRIYVWGWTARAYLASADVPATRQTLVGTLFRGYNVMTFPPVYQPSASSEAISAYYRNRELRDLQADPPALFIDAIGPVSWFLSSRAYYGFDRVPEIAAFVRANYVHLIDLYDERYFIRRDLAAERDAKMSRPLPPESCTPGSVVCLDAAVTLPRELPSVNIPAHARIELEFMPIGSQIGTATILNTEAQPGSFRGIRLQHADGDRYIVLAGTGNRYVVSKEFELPEGRPAFVTIDLDEHHAIIANNGSLLDQLSLERPVVDPHGPIDIGSWIDGMDPFSGKIGFFQIVAR